MKRRRVLLNSPNLVAVPQPTASCMTLEDVLSSLLALRMSAERLFRSKSKLQALGPFGLEPAEAHSPFRRQLQGRRPLRILVVHCLTCMLRIFCSSACRRKAAGNRNFEQYEPQAR